MTRKTCSRCRRTFNSKRGWQRFCSRGCRDVYWRELKRNGQEPTPKKSKAQPEIDWDFEMAKLGIENAIATHEHRAAALRAALSAMREAK